MIGTTEHLISMRLDCGKESNFGGLIGSRLHEERSQIPASFFDKASKDKKARTTIHALTGSEFWVMQGFQSGLKPELGMQKDC